MKTVYEFDSENPDDRDLLKIFQQARDMYSVIWEFTHNTKRRIADLTSEQQEGYEKALKDFYEFMEQYNVRCE